MWTDGSHQMLVIAENVKWFPVSASLANKKRGAVGSRETDREREIPFSGSYSIKQTGMPFADVISALYKKDNSPRSLVQMLLCKLGKPLASFDIDDELSCQQMDGRRYKFNSNISWCGLKWKRIHRASVGDFVSPTRWIPFTVSQKWRAGTGGADRPPSSVHQGWRLSRCAAGSRTGCSGKQEKWMSRS